MEHARNDASHLPGSCGGLSEKGGEPAAGHASPPQMAGTCAEVYGVSLRLLRSILADVAEALGKHATTADVVNDYVKPRTAAGRQRYVEWLLGNGHADGADVGTPMYFVSHAWLRPFEETVNMVLSHLSDAADGTHVW